MTSTLAAEKVIRMDSSWIPYLEGVTDASTGRTDITDAATELIGQITNFGSVLLWDSGNELTVGRPEGFGDAIIRG